jgi:hypothetical protein
MNSFKTIAFSFFIIICLTSKLYSQNTLMTKRKYCEDLGFGWFCIKFKSNGKYKEDGGHSYWVHRTYGKWTMRGDTIICNPKLVRKVKPYSIIYRSAKKLETSDKSYFLLTTDSIYALNLDTLTKKLERGIALKTTE